MTRKSAKLLAAALVIFGAGYALGFPVKLFLAAMDGDDNAWLYLTAIWASAWVLGLAFMFVFGWTWRDLRGSVEDRDKARRVSERVARREAGL